MNQEDNKRSLYMRGMIKELSKMWYRNEKDIKNRDIIHALANTLRKFNDEAIESAYLLNDIDGAKGFGHNAVMLVDENDYGVVFSVFPIVQGLKSFDTKAELRFSALDKGMVQDFVKINGTSTDIQNMPSTRNEIKSEDYHRLVKFDISKKQEKICSLLQSEDI